MNIELYLKHINVSTINVKRRANSWCVVSKAINQCKLLIPHYIVLTSYDIALLTDGAELLKKVALLFPISA